MLLPGRRLFLIKRLSLPVCALTVKCPVEEDREVLFLTCFAFICKEWPVSPCKQLFSTPLTDHARFLSPT